MIEDFCFEAYGVRVRITGAEQELVDLGGKIATKALVGKIRFIEDVDQNFDHTFEIIREEGVGYRFRDNGTIRGGFEDVRHLDNLLNSLVRIYVAEKAENWVFVHAGVVGWRGHAIILPAASYQGKTTLVAELIRLGAEYYSDEYAIFDSQGLIHPFDRPLSVRMSESLFPVDVDHADLGGATAKGPIPSGMVVFTNYSDDGRWDPSILSIGQGILKMVPQVISIKFSTEFALKALNTSLSRAIIIESPRGEADRAALSILSFFDNVLDSGRIV